VPPREVVDPLEKSMLTPPEAQYRKSGILEEGQIVTEFDNSMRFSTKKVE